MELIFWLIGSAVVVIITSIIIYFAIKRFKSSKKSNENNKKQGIEKNEDGLSVDKIDYSHVLNDPETDRPVLDKNYVSPRLQNINNTDRFVNSKKVDNSNFDSEACSAEIFDNLEQQHSKESIEYLNKN